MNSQCLFRSSFLLLLVTVGLIPVACTSADSPHPSGKIELFHEETRESEVVFDLVNGSSQAIRVRGSYKIWKRAVELWLGDSDIECRDVLDEDPFGLGDGRPRSVEIRPGQQLRLIIFSSFPYKHKGGRCLLRLKLEDGTIIGPSEFVP